jgi:hypothetical protein
MKKRERGEEKVRERERGTRREGSRNRVRE